jgi:N-acetylmuramoyl-L-alanine amidase
MQIKLRNRLHKTDNIAGATIRFTAVSPGTTTLTVTTNAHGVATVGAKALAPGNYNCSVDAPDTFAGDVGPGLADTGTPPNRIYRPVTLTVGISASGPPTVTPSNRMHADVTVTSALITVDIQPVWIKSSANSNRGQSISMIVVHHTACALGPAVATFLAEKGPHYMIDTDGQIVKWVQDGRAAWHAGEARWHGHSDINARSIGIEIVHATGSYPVAQYSALLDLLGRLRSGHTSINSWDIIGHSDVGTNASGRLGRKSGDPGAQFEWVRLENRGYGMIPAAGPPAPNVYAGFFQTVPGGSLRHGDNDKHHKFGGAVRAAITGTPIHEIQQDLTDIGYSLGTVDGDYGDKMVAAVRAFQEHFFAGSRGPAADGKVDFQTASWIRAVADAANVPAVTPAAAGAGTGP